MRELTRRVPAWAQNHASVPGERACLASPSAVASEMVITGAWLQLRRGDRTSLGDAEIYVPKRKGLKAPGSRNRSNLKTAFSCNRLSWEILLGLTTRQRALIGVGFLGS